MTKETITEKMLAIRLEANKNLVPDDRRYRIATVSLPTAAFIFANFEIKNRLFGFSIQIDQEIPEGEIVAHYAFNQGTSYEYRQPV